jgi:hypothetical protein
VLQGQTDRERELIDATRRGEVLVCSQLSIDHPQCRLGPGLIRKAS